MKKLFYLLMFSSFLSLAAQNEATTDEVQNRNGVVYKNNLPFTGTLYGGSTQTHNDCKCTLEANYTNGLLHGSKKEYYSSGKIKFSGEFTTGKEQGEHIFYDSNGNVTSSNKFSNGKRLEYVTLNPISQKNALFSFFVINPPDSYTDEFLRSYLYHFDKEYSRYRSNEFELKHKMNDARNEVIGAINNINLNKSYKASGETKLGKYSFENNNFNLRIYFENPFSNANSFSFFQINMYSNNIKIGKNAPEISYTNSQDFLSIDLPSSKAENFKNSLSQNTLYYTYEYKILPNINKDERYNVITGISAYISKVIFYSDKALSTPIYTIDKSNDHTTTKVDGYKKNSSTAKTQNTHQVMQNSIETKTTEFDILEKAAKEGNAQSQFELANMYFDGREISKDDSFAYYWYQKSAENGNANAQEAFGAIYFELKKYQEAFGWYLKAAQSNLPQAQFVLGYMYLNGLGTKKSRKDAKSWWKKSCNLGFTNSCEEINKMNAFGNALLNTVNESLKNYTPKN